VTTIGYYLERVPFARKSPHTGEGSRTMRGPKVRDSRRKRQPTKGGEESNVLCFLGFVGGWVGVFVLGLVVLWGWVGVVWGGVGGPGLGMTKTGSRKPAQENGPHDAGQERGLFPPVSPSRDRRKRHTIKKGNQVWERREKASRTRSSDERKRKISEFNLVSFDIPKGDVESKMKTVPARWPMKKKGAK